MNTFVLVFCIIILLQIMVRNNTQSFSLRSVLEKDKLNETNYADWICNLRIVLRAEKKEDILDTPLPEEPR